MPITTSPRTVSVTEGSVVVFNSFVTDDLGRPFTGTLQWTLNLGGTGNATLTDFNLASTTGTVSIVNGVATVRLPTRVDDVVEISERFSVTLTVPGRLWSDIVSGTISEPVVAPTVTANLSSSAAAVIEGNSGVTLVTYTITLSAPAVQSTTISYVTQLLTAQASDFSGGTVPSGSLTFSTGERTKTFTVAIAPDLNVEADESFSVALTSATAGVIIGSSRSVTTTITNDDGGSTGGGTSGSIATIGNDSLIGTFGPDSINGLAGNDTISGGQGNDTIMGGSGDDLVDGGGGADSLDGGEGSDVYLVTSVSDMDGAVSEINDSGTAGVDELRFAATLSSTLSLSPGVKGIERIIIGTGLVSVAIGTATTQLGVNASSAVNAMVIIGNAGPNTLSGSSFSDTLDGQAGDDVLIGGLGNDILIGGTGSDTLNGGDGVDTANYETATDDISLSLSISTAQFAGAAGTDVLSGVENISSGSGNDSLIGDFLANNLTGGAGRDTLDGGSGNDSLFGGLGDDILIGGLGDDSIYGGDGVDTVSYEAATSGVSVNLSIQDVSAQNTVSAGIDRLVAVENLIGSSLNDFLLGNSFVNQIFGGFGEDVIEGGGATDQLNGGEGRDIYLVFDVAHKVAAEIADTGASGTDELRFAATSAGTLSLFAGDLGLERVVIGTGTANLPDTTSIAALSVDAKFAANGLSMLGNAGSNTLTGSAFSDLIDSGAGDDVLNGGAGNDFLAGGAGNDLIIGGIGVDEVGYLGSTENLSVSLAILTGQSIGSFGIDTISGVESVMTGSGNDRLVGDANANTLNGSIGNDTLEGGLGNDVLIGGEGIDTASYATSAAAVTVSLNLGTAQGGAGADTLSLIENLIGSSFNDTLTGTAIENVIDGGNGNDLIIGGLGADSLFGGLGDDVFLFESNIELQINESITGGAGFDEVRYSSTVLPSTSASALVIGSTVTVERVVIGTGTAFVADTTGVLSLNVNAVSASTAILIIGNAGSNILTGSAFSDTLEGGLGNDFLYGGAGSDTASYSGSISAVTVSLALATAQNTLGAGTDTLNLIENLVGSSLNDTLIGNSVANRIDGGAGNDVINGAAGLDTLDGGDGSDIYMLTLSADKMGAEIADTGLNGMDELRFAATVASALSITNGDKGLERVVIGTGTALSADTAATTALSVDATLAANGLTIVGNAGFNIITGSAFADIIDGGLANDDLSGRNGNDRLIGGNGNDALTGGSGADAFVFNFAPNATTNRDTILDFVSVDDTIELARSVMTGLGPLGTLYSANFRFGAGITTAGDATDRIIYNTTTGALYYDFDGTGAGAAVQFAQLIGNPTLSFSDFLII